MDALFLTNPIQETLIIADMDIGSKQIEFLTPADVNQIAFIDIFQAFCRYMSEYYKLADQRITDVLVDKINDKYRSITIVLDGKSVVVKKDDMYGCYNLAELKFLNIYTEIRRNYCEKIYFSSNNVILAEEIKNFFIDFSQKVALTKIFREITQWAEQQVESYKKSSSKDEIEQTDEFDAEDMPF